MDSETPPMMPRAEDTEKLDAGIIKNLLLSYNPAADTDLIDRAYQFARDSHRGQKRSSGEPYIIHPVEVATILAEHRFDAITLAAALLHDVVEDCGVTIEDISARFGEEVADLVAGVTKIRAIKPQSRQESQAENLRKMLVAMARDVRVLLIRLADRLHNMRTIGSLSPERIERISRETIEIYAPLANRMGMSTIRAELEELAFQHLKPDVYANLSESIGQIIGERRELVSEAKEILLKKLNDAGIRADVSGRAKETYSIHKKMERQGKPVEEIYDLLAMRILVSTVKDCYGAVGIVHSVWKPMPRRFKDYIAIPKPNMYQALHTTVFGPGKAPLEIQIKTHQMHLTAEEGIAAHWRYKSAGTVDERMGWLRRILEWQRDTVTAEEFMDSLRIDLYSDHVFVLTPKGEILELPAGSTPIDLAFQVHTELGLHVVGAKIDGRLVPITSTLQSGSVVEILTSPNAHPSRDWLEVVRSPRARQKIRHYFREAGADQMRARGGEQLQEAIDKKGLEYSVAQGSPELVEIAQQAGFHSLNALLEAIGFGNESVESIVRKLSGAKPQPRKTKRKYARPTVPPEKSVIIDGHTDLEIRFGRCCSPVPGDMICGYLSRGRGITIHRQKCSTLKSLRHEPERLMPAGWTRSDSRFTAGVKLEAEDRIGLLADTTDAIARHGGNIVSAEIKTRGVGRDLFLVEVESVEQLEKILSALRQIDGITSVSRSLPR